MKTKKKNTPMYMAGGEIKKMPGGGMMKREQMPMYMYGGRTYKAGGTMLKEMAKDPEMFAQMEAIVGKG